MEIGTMFLFFGVGIGIGCVIGYLLAYTLEYKKIRVKNEK